MPSTPPIDAVGPRDPLPAMAVAALALGLAVQLLLPAAPATPGLAAALRRPPAAALAASATPPVLGAADPAILARPLFTRGRSGQAVAIAAPVGAFVLLGVATGGARAVASVQDAAGQLRTVRPGEAVQGWRLAAVGRDRASFSRDGAVQVLRVGQQGARPVLGAPPAAGHPAGADD